MWPDTHLQSLFGIDLPIIQAPMAGSSGLDMAVAVAGAGGLGSLACAPLSPNDLAIFLQEARQKTDRPLNANFFADGFQKQNPGPDAGWLARLTPYYEELAIRPPSFLSAGIVPFDEDHCAVVENAPPAIVSFHFGLPKVRLVERVKAAGSLVISSATTVAEARWLEANGCDAIIAQGYEAGGHRGMFLTDDIQTQMGTFSLVPQIVDAVSVPVIAAGGIADGRGVAAALALGASGVQVGTAYLFTAEATANDIYRTALADRASPTAVTNVFSGRPSRCRVNRAVRELGPMAGDAPAFPKGFSAMGGLRQAAEQAGSPDFSAHFCGQSADLCRPTGAGELTRQLAAEAQSIWGLSGGASGT